METKKIGDATTVTNVATGDKIVGVNAAGAMQTIEPVKMLASLLGKATATSTPATTLYVPLVDANGNQQKVSIADLAAVVSGVGVLRSSYDNVFIMFHRNSDNYPLMVKPDKWASYQSSGEIAEGVVVVEGGKCLVIAPTESTSNLYWSSAAISGGGFTTGDRMTAIGDWAGKANTAAQIAASTTSAVTNTASYAPGFCNLYSKTNTNGKGLTAGKWWLPSMGEMMAIYANMLKINYALSLISGATQLVEDWYWTSTEYSATYAWDLRLANGTVNYYTKATDALHVRPVSAFIY